MRLAVRCGVHAQSWHIDRGDALACVFAGDQRVVELGVLRAERTILKRGAVLLGERYPVAHHVAVRRRCLREDHRVLHCRKKRVENRTRRALRRLLGRPYEHVGVDGRIAGCKPKVADELAYLVRVRRTVRRADHVAVLTYRRAHVLLAKLYEDIWPDCRQAADDILHQCVDCNGNRTDVTPGVAVFLRRIPRLRDLELVYEVEFETVEAPVPNGALVGLHKVLADLRKPRVENPDVRRARIEQLVPEALPRCGFVPDERHSKPEHVALDPGLVHAAHVRLHVRKSFRHRHPVARRRVVRPALRLLPSVVKDHRLHAERGRELRLRLKLPRMDVLPEGVPRRV